MHTHNNQMAEKLGGVRNSVRRSEDYFHEERNNRLTLPAAHTIGRDGVDHINIWERSSTEFGIILDQFQDTPFEHPMYGRFRSVDGFWHYLRSPTRDDRNRSAYGKRIKTLGTNNNYFERVENFRYIIMDATWHKVIQYPAIVAEMKVNKLPFDMYLLHNNDPRVRIRPKAAFWMVPGMEEIRKAICEDRKPDFDFLLDVEGSKRPDLSGHFVKHKAAKLTGMFTSKPEDKPTKPVSPELQSMKTFDTEQSIALEAETVESSTIEVIEQPVENGVEVINQ